MPGAHATGLWSRRSALLERHQVDARDAEEEPPAAFLSADVRDSVLRMLFVCCDAAIPLESQLVLALESLCGFDVAEIAQRLFTSEDSIYKRLGRARSRLRETQLVPDEVSAAQLVARLPAVQTILYTLFTEGATYLWSAALADLHRRCGHAELAQRYRAAAVELAPSQAVMAALQRRLGAAHPRG